MTMAGVLVFSYVSVVPLVLWSAFKYYSISIGLAQLLCLYGYAVLTFIPAAVRVVVRFSLLFSHHQLEYHLPSQLSCLFGLSILDWLALLAAVGISTKLLVDNTLPAVTAQLPTMGRAGVAAIAGVQIFFGLVLKLYFFRHE